MIAKFNIDFNTRALKLMLISASMLMLTNKNTWTRSHAEVALDIGNGGSLFSPG